MTDSSAPPPVMAEAREKNFYLWFCFGKNSFSPGRQMPLLNRYTQY